MKRVRRPSRRTPQHHHRAPDEVYDCRQCRESAIDVLSAGPYGFVLLFGEPDEHTFSSISVLRAWDVHDAIEDAWITGCNPGGWVAKAGPMPAAIVVNAGVPLFRNIREPAATEALDALDVAGLHIDRRLLQDPFSGDGRCPCGRRHHEHE